MNNTDPNSTAVQFEKISPVLEMIYVMVKNMHKYLKVYAEDIQASSLPEYKKTADALMKVKETLDEVYHITDKAPMPKEKEMKDQVVMNQPEDKPMPMEKPVAEPMPMAAEEPKMDAPAPAPAPVPAPATGDAVAKDDNDKVKSILDELRQMQQGGAPAASE